MTQVRERYGERLHDPAVVLELVIALGVERAAGLGRPPHNASN
jgi:hypothetical protein